MSLIKDVLEDSKDYRLRTRLLARVNPKEYKRHHKWRKQRMDRGWSDRDTWGAGDHIAKMVAEMLQHLNDNTYTDWPEWFKLNVKEEGKGAYKNLQQVIDDINAYLVHSETTWGDDLTTDSSIVDSEGHLNIKWYDKKGKKLSEQQVTARIKKWAEEDNNLYKKATKAMQFFGRHFAGFWD